MKRVWIAIRLATLTLALLQTSQAQEADDATASEEFSRFELVPFVGYQFGGGFEIQDQATAGTQNVDVDGHGNFALAFDWRADALLQYELFYSRQATHIEASPTLASTALDVEYLHFGGTSEFADLGVLRPYAVGSIGFTRLSLDAPGLTDETPFSISLGVGLRVPVKPRFNIRLEARAFLSFLQSDSSLFCSSGATGGLACCAAAAPYSLNTRCSLELHSHFEAHWTNGQLA